MTVNVCSSLLSQPHFCNVDSRQAHSEVHILFIHKKYTSRWTPNLAIPSILGHCVNSDEHPIYAKTMPGIASQHCLPSGWELNPAELWLFGGELDQSCLANLMSSLVRT